MSTDITASFSKVRIFISHNQADDELGKFLTRELRRKLNDPTSVWYNTESGRYNSKSGVRPGDDWPNEIDKNLRSSNVFLLLWSRHSRKAKWVQDEIRQARYLSGSKGMKILTICIDLTKPPVFWQHLQCIYYSSGEDFQKVLDGILQFLRLPPDTDDLNTKMGRQNAFDMEVAFNNKEWGVVNQYFSVIVSHYPSLISSSLCFMQAIALLERGNLLQSRKLVNEGLALDKQERDSDLLYSYAQILIRNKQWQEVFLVANQCVARFPDETRWYELRDQTFLNQSRGATSYNQNQFFSSSEQSTSLLSPNNQQPGGLKNNSTNLLALDDVDISASHLEALSKPTRELPYEELYAEEPPTAPQSGVLNTMNDFAEKHLHHNRLSKLLRTPSWIITLLLNFLLLPIIFNLLYPSTLAIWTNLIVIFLILIFGRIAGKGALGFCFAMPLSLYWGTVGYCLSIDIHTFIGWSSNAPSAIWLGGVCALLGGLVGFYWHQELFRKQI